MCIEWFPPYRRFSPLQIDSSNQASSSEINKKRTEKRLLQTHPVTAEQIGFPLVEQAALLRREIQGHQAETVALITSCSPQQLTPEKWLALNRQHWGIESGLHQRLDVSHLDDLSRIGDPNAMWVKGIFTRFTNSLFVHWQSQHKKPKHKTTTDFFSFMAANHARKAFSFINSSKPTLKPKR